MSKFTNILKKLIFNPKWTCNNCGKEIFNGKFYCEECENSFTIINENKCAHCGRSSKYPVEFCDSCIDKNIDFDVCRSVYEYLPPVSNLVKSVKYNDKRYLIEDFANKLKNVYVKEFFRADCITFVPSSSKTLKERGYNQGEILARELAKLLDIEVISEVYRVKETVRQATLQKADRLKNLIGAFKASKTAFKNKRVLIVDDVITTGATVNEIAKTLKKCGASYVYVLTISSVGELTNAYKSENLTKKDNNFVN